MEEEEEIVTTDPRTTTAEEEEREPVRVVQLNNANDNDFNNRDELFFVPDVPTTTEHSADKDYDYYMNYDYKWNDDIDPPAYLDSDGELAQAYLKRLKRLSLEIKRREAVHQEFLLQYPFGGPGSQQDQIVRRMMHYIISVQKSIREVLRRVVVSRSQDQILNMPFTEQRQISHDFLLGPQPRWAQMDR